MEREGDPCAMGLRANTDIKGPTIQRRIADAKNTLKQIYEYLTRIHNKDKGMDNGYEDEIQRAERVEVFLKRDKERRDGCSSVGTMETRTSSE